MEQKKKYHMYWLLLAGDGMSGAGKSGRRGSRVYRILLPRGGGVDVGWAALFRRAPKPLSLSLSLSLSLALALIRAAFISASLDSHEHVDRIWNTILIHTTTVVMYQGSL